MPVLQIHVNRRAGQYVRVVLQIYGARLTTNVSVNQAIRKIKSVVFAKKVSNIVILLYCMRTQLFVSILIY